MEFQIVDDRGYVNSVSTSDSLVPLFFPAVVRRVRCPSARP